MLTKLKLVEGAYKFLVISGITTNPNNEELIDGVQVADDLAAELLATLNLGYIQPINYGESQPNDYSGLTAELAGPFKKMLAREIAVFFGKEITTTLNRIYEDGLRNLENCLVTVSQAQNPATLPIGSGNEYDYRSNKFYSEPNNDDGAINFYQDEEFPLNIDWSAWLAGISTLNNVAYDTSGGGLLISEESIKDNLSLATVSFSTAGQFDLCVTATNSLGDKKTDRFVFNSNDCKRGNKYIQ